MKPHFNKRFVERKISAEKFKVMANSSFNKHGSNPVIKLPRP